MTAKIPLPLLKVAIHEEDDRGNVYTLLEPFYYCGLEFLPGSRATAHPCLGSSGQRSFRPETVRRSVRL